MAERYAELVAYCREHKQLRTVSDVLDVSFMDAATTAVKFLDAAYFIRRLFRDVTGEHLDVDSDTIEQAFVANNARIVYYRGLKLIAGACAADMRMFEDLCKEHARLLCKNI